ncbi:MAG: beta-propeller fold lactonase family protein [Lachnospiraceae bacterium]|nr:beta-propeller fold lactonase family protein [Lachnospiraceae bacterium]
MVEFEKVVLMLNNYDIYVASYSRTGGIYHYKMVDEVLELINITGMDRPMYMIVSKNKMNILLREVMKGKESGVVAYDMDADGKLTNPSDVVSTKGEVACHLTEVDGAMYCVNYISGSVIKLPDKLAVHSGNSIHPKRQQSSHPHYVCASPDGKYILVTDLGLDKIFVYTKNLELHSITDMPAGHGPRHLVCHPDEKRVYCANELGSTLSELAYEDGVLTLKNTVSTIPPGYHGANAVAAIRYNKDKIYVTNRGHNSIVVMDENLRIENLFSCGGEEPRDIWIMDDVIICTNQFSDKVCFISAQDGSLLEEIKLEAPLCVVCVKNEKFGGKAR